jgi:hypothetical protein
MPGLPVGSFLKAKTMAEVKHAVAISAGSIPHAFLIHIWAFVIEAHLPQALSKDRHTHLLCALPEMHRLPNKPHDIASAKLLQVYSFAIKRAHGEQMPAIIKFE